MAIPEILRRYREAIVAQLEDALRDGGPLGEMLAYHMGLREANGEEGPGIGGKLLRPSLVCFSCEALGGDYRKALPFACALELVHNFSLIHDDVQDRDELRRGRPTVWVVFGTEQAINAGDGLYTLALRVALAARDVLPAKSVLEGIEALIDATYRMIEGQVLDISLEGNNATVAEYLEMARKKTGALLACALELGAIAAGNPGFRDSLRELGEILGLAFQIRDDWIGIWGDPERTGKPAGSDLLRRKRSFPVVLALERDPGLGGLLVRDPLPLEEALARLEATGAREAAAEEVRKYAAEADRLAAELPWEPWAKVAFEEFLSFLAEREA